MKSLILPKLGLGKVGKNRVGPQPPPAPNATVQAPENLDKILFCFYTQLINNLIISDNNQTIKLVKYKAGYTLCEILLIM